MHQHKNNGRTTALAKRAMLGAMVATALVAAPANAGVGPDGVRAGHELTVFHNIDMLILNGYTAGQQMQVDVLRGGHRISTVSAPAAITPDGAGLELNHGPAGAPQPGDCFDGATPNIQPGDRIRVSNPGGPAGVDDVIVDRVLITSRTTVTRDAQGGPVVVIPGQPAVADDPLTPENEARPEVPETTEPTRQEVWVQGTAHTMNADGTVGAAIPASALDGAGFIDLPNDNQLRVSPSEVVAGAAPGDYIVKYYDDNPASNTDGFEVDRNDSNRNDQSIFNAIASGVDGHAVGYGHTEPAPPVAMLVDGLEEATAPGPGCETVAPKFASSIGMVDTKQINVNNAGPAVADGATVLTLGGFAAGGVTAATVQISDGTTTKQVPVTGLDPASLATGPQQGWTAVVTKGDLAGLNQGNLTFRLNAGGLIGATKTVPYSLATPAFSVSLASGTYEGARSVTITRPAGAPQPSFRLNGGPSTPYNGTAIQLGIGTHTLEVSATDGAGNTTVQTFTYTITAAKQQQAQQTQTVAPAPVQQLAAPQAAPSRVLPAATLLSSSKRVTASAAKRKGLVSRFSAPAGAKTAVIRVFRSKGGKLTRVGSKTTSVKQGRNSVKLNSKALRRKLTAGLYAVQVTLRASDGAAGAAQTSMVRITK